MYLLENVAKTGRVSFCARGANYAQNQVARTERENSRREEGMGDKRNTQVAAIEHACQTPPCRPRATMRSPCATTLKAATATLFRDEKRRERERGTDELDSGGERR